MKMLKKMAALLLAGVMALALLTACGDDSAPSFAQKTEDAAFGAMKQVWGDRIFEKCGIGRDEGGDGGKTLEIRGKRRLSARDGGANYQQS